MNADDALELAARGWPILWLHAIKDGRCTCGKADCSTPAKHPRTAHGVDDATTDPETVRAWAERWPHSNIGIATGAPGPDVIDIDDPETARDLALACGQTNAPMVATSRGVHFYFRGTDGPSLAFPWGEVKRRRTYVVTPPSAHESGKVYTWLLSPNGALPHLPDGLVSERSSVGAGESQKREHVGPGSMYDYLVDRAVRLARAGEGDVDVVEQALLAAFELKREPGKAYSGDTRDTRRIAEWAVTSEIAERERKSDSSRFGRYRDSRRRPQDEAPPDADRYAGRILNVPKLLSEPDEDTLWRCDRFVADGFLTTLAGVHGEGKSWLALALACAVARGKRAAGLDCAAGNAVIFDAENGPKLMIRRFRAIGDADLPVSLVDVGGLHVLRDIDWIKQTVIDIGAQFVVLDSLRMLSSGAKENDGDVMEPIITALKMLARETDTGVLLIHHRGKSEGSDYRGTSVIGDQTDLMFHLERVKDDPDGATRRRLACRKCRIDEEPEPRWLEINADRDAGTVRIGRAAAYEPERERPRDDHQQGVLAALSERPLSVRRVAEAAGLASTTAHRVLHDLERDGKAQQVDGGWTVPLFRSTRGVERVEHPETPVDKPDSSVPPFRSTRGSGTVEHGAVDRDELRRRMTEGWDQ